MMQMRWLVLLFIFLSSGLSQEMSRLKIEYPVQIDTVIIIGNEKTDDTVLLREIPHQLPAKLTEAELVRIQQRLLNLFLFNRVELQIATILDKTALLISVTESWYIFPLPLLFINEKDWDKISYGLQFSHFNFRGKNEKLNVGGWLGYNPSFFVSYFNPWIGHNSKLILGLSFAHRKRANKIFDFDEERTGFKITFGRKFNLRLSTRLEFSLNKITLPGIYKDFLCSEKSYDLSPGLTYSALYDDRDLKEYPKKGLYGHYKIQRNGFNDQQAEFWRLKLDSRIYQPIYKNISFALRNYVVMNHGKLPIYDRSFIGYGERIRGHYEIVFPASEKYLEYPSPELMLNSLEIRIPLIPVRYYSYKASGLLANFSKDMKFGLSCAFFMDSGIYWENKADFQLKRMNSGYGFGLHFHLPYVNVLRFDYAWNENRDGELIIDMGVNF